jgi:hypothetical protein
MAKAAATLFSLEGDHLSATDLANVLRLVIKHLETLAPPPLEDSALTVKDIAKVLKVSESYVYTHASTWPFSWREGRKLRFSRRGLQSYLDSKREGA